MAGPPAEEGQKREPDDGHAAGKPIHAVHEIVEVGHPEEKQDAHRRGEPAQSNDADTGDRHGRESEPDAPHDNRRGGRLRSESDPDRQPAAIVEKRNDGHEGDRSDDP